MRHLTLYTCCVLVELHNSQVMVKGCETPGFLIISAARVRVISYRHMPIWRASQLRSKSTWSGNVDCMQVGSWAISSFDQFVYLREVRVWVCLVWWRN